MEESFCIMCEHARFLDPKKEICWKTGGLYCTIFERIVAKYDNCLDPEAVKKAVAKGKDGNGGKGGRTSRNKKAKAK